MKQQQKGAESFNSEHNVGNIKLKEAIGDAIETEYE